MFASAGIAALFLLGIIVVECTARHGHGMDVPKDKSIECYECNSEYDPRCGDPFDPYTIGKVNCSMKRPLSHIPFVKPTLCRKTVQKVQGHVRIIRGCGYIPHDRDDKECLARSGTHDVQVKYCACKHNLCNTGRQTSPSRVIAGVLVMGAMRLLVA